MKTVLYLILAAGIVFDVVAGVYLWKPTQAPKGSGARVRSDAAASRRVTEREADLPRPASPFYSRFCYRARPAQQSPGDRDGAWPCMKKENHQ